MNAALVIIAILAVVVLFLGLLGFYIASLWILYRKAGRPGWAAIVPFYSTWVLATIGGKPGWWGLLAYLGFSFNYSSTSSGSSSTAHIPVALIVVLVAVGIVSLVFNILICIGVSHNFGRSTGFGWVLALLPFIGMPMLAFGKAQYIGPPPPAAHLPVASASSPAPPGAPPEPRPYKASEDPSLMMVLPINRSGWAIAAGYLGLLSILVIPAPFAVLAGILALRSLKKHPGKLGKGRAWFGIIAGALGTLFLAFIIAGMITGSPSTP